MSFRWIFQLLNKLWLFLSYLLNKQFRKVLQYQPVKYDLYPLSPGMYSFKFKHLKALKNCNNLALFFSVKASLKFSSAENASA